MSSNVARQKTIGDDVYQNGNYIGQPDDHEIGHWSPLRINEGQVYYLDGRWNGPTPRDGFSHKFSKELTPKVSTTGVQRMIEEYLWKQGLGKYSVPEGLPENWGYKKK
jgi:hypothetical protein